MNHATMKTREYENGPHNAVARVPRRAGSRQALRRRGTKHSFRAALNSCAPQACLQKEVSGESESPGTEAEGQAFLFPRPCRLIERSVAIRFSDQFFVGDPLADDLADADVEAFGVRGFAVVVAKRLFIQIPEQVERFHADVCAVQATLQEAPEVFHSVGMDVSVDVFNGVVDDGVLVVRLQSIVGQQFVTEDRRARFDVFTDRALKFFLCSRFNMHDANVAAAFHHTEHDLFAISAATFDLFRPLPLVHIASLLANERFIHFDTIATTAKLAAMLSLLGQSDPVKHKPSGLLGDSQGSVNLTTRDAVFGVQDEPHCREPLIQTNWGVFENGSYFNGELAFRVPDAALPAQLIIEEANSGTTADGAYNAVGPLGTTSNEVVKTVLLVREVNDGFLQCLGVVGGFHV